MGNERAQARPFFAASLCSLARSENLLPSRPVVRLRQRRWFFLSVIAIAYVAFASLRTSGGRGFGLIALVSLPLLLSLGWSRTAQPSNRPDTTPPSVRAAARAILFGAALFLAARSTFARDAMLEAAANVGTAFAAVGALVALARVDESPGLLTVPKAARKLDLALLVALLFAFPTGLALASLTPDLVVETRALDATSSFASGMGFVLALFAAARAHLLRGLELGTGDRTRAALTTLGLALLIASATAALELASLAWALQGGLTLASLVVGAICLARDPVAVARRHRVALVVAMGGAPLVLVAASLALRDPDLAGLLVLGAAVGGIVIGLVARTVTEPIERDRSRWLSAIEAAHARALDPRPDRAILGALVALREAAGQPERPPALWRIGPGEVLHADHAGYLHARSASLPEAVLEAAAEEPEGTLRTEVLEALEVRRPELRPALSFLRREEAFAATLLRLDEETTGILVMARGRRTSSLTLEEARALRALAERLASALEVGSQLSRAHERELAEKARADAEDDKARHLAHLLATAGARFERDAERLARVALAAAYSPAMRLLLDELRRHGALGMPVVLCSSLGVDPLPYAAVVHLAGPRKSRPFLLVDGANPAEQPLSLWQDPLASPLSTADSGTLVVTSIEALPHDTQRFLALTLATRRSPSGRATPLDLHLVASMATPVDEALASGRLTPELADRLGQRTLMLPSLADRPEDLRALTLERLGRIGIRLRGEPMGIEAKAMARLVEHAWPGDELELSDVLTRAAAVAKTQVLRREDLDAIGFVPRERPAEGESGAEATLRGEEAEPRGRLLHDELA